MFSFGASYHQFKASAMLNLFHPVGTHHTGNNCNHFTEGEIFLRNTHPLHVL